MTEEQFNVWLVENSLEEQARLIVSRIRQSEPSRSVQSRHTNVTGRYPSIKMGCTIQFESHKVELPFIREFEHSDEVLEYYDQPEPIKLTFTGKNGKRVSPMTTADFFVLHRDGTAGWIECKPEKELIALAEKSDRFRRNDDGFWSSPAGEEYADRFGLFYHVRSSAEINWTYQRNLAFLEDYLREKDRTPDPAATTLILALVYSQQGILLSDILRHEDRFSPDDVFLLLTRGELYADIHAHILVEPERTPVFTDRSLAESHVPLVAGQRQLCQEAREITIEPGGRVDWDGRPFTIVNAGEKHLWLQDDQGKIQKLTTDYFHTLVNSAEIRGIQAQTGQNDEVHELLRRKNPKDLSAACERLKSLEPFLNGCGIRPSSTDYFWLKRHKEAESKYGSGFLGLIDRKRERGNRNDKLPAEVYKLIEQCIDEIYLDIRKPKIKPAYGTFRNKCEEAGVPAASYKSFCIQIRKIDEKKRVLEREGPRAAYQVDIKYWELTQTTPRHGDRPFEISHIDHTELDIQIVDSKTFKPLARPWLTLMVDAYSRRILAYFLTFEPPSYRSCMMVLRECVRRFNRLPQTIVVDGGKEFKSKYFESFLAHHVITKKDRPPKQGRFGSVMERLFGTTNTQFIYNLRGNTQIMKNVRQATKSVNPENHAIWTLSKLAERLEEFLFEVYDTTEHPALGESPRDCFTSGIALFGSRPARFISYDRSFELGSLPSTPRGVAKVIPSRGVKINNVFYRCEAFRSPLVANTEVYVLYDPFNVGIAYAFVTGEWVRCTSEYFEQLNGLTEYELKWVSEELSKRRKNHNANFNVTAQKIAEFVEENRRQEDALKVQKLAAETRAANGNMLSNDENETLEAVAGDFTAPITADDITETYEDL